MNFWIKNPGKEDYSATLTFSVYALALCLVKFLLNGVTIEIMSKHINFGTIDSGLIAAILAPTLSAYTLKKFAPSAPSTETKEPSQ